MKKKILFIGILVIFLAGNIYTTNEYRFLHIPFLAIGFGSLTIYMLINIQKKIFLDRYLLILIFLLILSMSMSSLINTDEFLIIAMVGLCGSITILYVVSSLQVKSLDNYYDNIWRSVILLFLLLVGYSLFFFPVGGAAYSGLFYSSNAFGNMIASVSAVVLARGVIMLVKGKNIIMHLLVTLGLLYLLLLSGSRTSLFAFGGTIILIVLIYLIKQSTSIAKFIKVLFSIGILSVITILTVTKVDFFNTVFERRIVSKFIQKSDNPLDGRGEVWLQTFHNSTMFGNGRSHFDSLGLGHGAHNTFISLLGQFGWITLLVFLILLSYIMIKSIYKLFKKDDISQYYLLATCSSFIILSMGEAMLMKFSMFIFFITLGSLNSNEKKEDNLHNNKLIS